jgi:hypothetical protein
MSKQSSGVASSFETARCLYEPLTPEFVGERNHYSGDTHSPALA